MTILEKIIKLHADLISFGSKVQATSAKKIDNDNHINELVYSVFYKITAYGTTIHRAVLTLCMSGWTHINAILLRTLIECSVNCLAITNNEYPDYMAFKYLYHPHVQIIRDRNYQDKDRKSARLEIETAIKNLKNKSLQDKANDYIKSNRIDYFWFKPEEKGISSIINDYGSNSLKSVYGTFSSSIHAGHLGLFFLKDDPDDININPCENPIKSKFALVTSCRLLLELLDIRNSFEGLGYYSEYEKFLKRILKFKYDTGLRFG